MTARLPIGIHDNVPERDYHADCAADGPSLSSSVVKILLNATPRHAWTVHPRLNPAFEDKADGRFDLGSVAHKLILGAGADFHIVEADAWTTKAAKAERDEARANGLTPILAQQAMDADEIACAVRDRLREIPETRGLFGPPNIMHGRPERVGIWHDVGGALCRMMIDWQGPELTDLWDTKTTGVALDDDSLARLIVNTGYDVQAAFYLRGATHLWPDLAGRFRWRWVFVENSAPHEVRVVEPSAEMLSIGDRKAALAIELWRRCIEAGLWPGYPPVVTRIAPPAWSMERWLAREQVEDAALSFHPMSSPLPSQVPEILGAC